MWTAIDRLSIIWKSSLSNRIKRDFFQAVAVSILLYGFTTWMLRKRMEQKLDGNYIRMLRAIFNKSWKQIPRNNSCTATYFPSQKPSKTCRRSKDKFISDVLLWTPTHRRAIVSRPARIYLHQLCADTECSLEDLLGAMDDKDRWRERERERESHENPHCQRDLIIMMMVYHLKFPWLHLHLLPLNILSVIKLVTFVEGDPKAPFSIAITPRCRGGRYLIPCIAPLYP